MPLGFYEPRAAAQAIVSSIASRLPAHAIVERFFGPHLRVLENLLTVALADAYLRGQDTPKPKAKLKHPLRRPVAQA